MTRGRAVTAQVTYFSGKKPDGVIGRQAYEDHDPTTTWDDGGIAHRNVYEDYDSLIQDITKAIENFREAQAAEMRAYGAAQAQEAVLDYICESNLEVALHDGHVILSLDASSDGVELRPWWYLEDLLTEALEAAGARGPLADAVTALAESVSDRLAPPPPPPPAIEAPSRDRASTRSKAPRQTAPAGRRRRASS